MRQLFFIFSVLLLIQASMVSAQAPDLSRIPDYNDKIKAWIAYCDTLRLNPHGIKGNFEKLQEAASLGLEMTKPDDYENRSKFYNHEAIGNYYQVKFDTAQYYFYKALASGQDAKSAQLIARACVSLIPVNFQLQQPEKVDQVKNILQSILDTTKNLTILQDGYSALGSYYQQKSYYSTAQDFYIKSIQLREKQVDSSKDARKKFDYAILCDMLSKLYLNTQMTDKSIAILRQGQRFADVSPNVLNRLLSSFVEAYTMSGNIDSALYYNNQLQANAKNSASFTSEIVSSDLNIGTYYIDHQNYGKALFYINRGDTTAARMQQPLLIFQAQMIKGRYMEETGKYDQAIALLNQSMPVAKQLSRSLYCNDLRYMALAQKGSGNIKEAVKFYELYSEQTDSLTKETQSRNFADMQTRYETSQKEDRIQSLDKENRLKVLELQNASRTRLVLIIGLAALGIISLLLYFIYRDKEKINKVLNNQNEQLAELNGKLALANETKAKLFGIIGHDLRSPVSKIVQLLQLQKEKSVLLDESSRVRHEEKLKQASENVLETMEDLLLWSKSQMQHFSPQFSEVNLFDVTEKELALVLQQAEDKKIRISLDFPANFSQYTDENFVSVIIRNLLQNSVKYADPESVISISGEGKIYSIKNQSAQGNATQLNARVQNKQIDSKNSGLGLQIAADLAVSIHAKLFFTEETDHTIKSVLSWENGVA